MITPSLLTIHLLLFGIKVWAVIMLSSKFRVYPYLLIWSVIYLLIEAWFLHKFFIELDLYLYEIFAIVDQVIFTIGLVFYLIKEGENG